MSRKLGTQNFLLYLFFFSLNFEVWDPFNTGGNFSVAKLTGFLYTFSLIFKIQYFLKSPRGLKTHLRLILFFYIFLFLISLFNINVYSSDFIQFSILQNLILLVFLLNHERLNSGVLEKSFIFFLLGSLVLAACFYLGIGLEKNVEGRVSLFGDNENIIGVRMVVSALVLTHIILKYRKRISKFIYALLPFGYLPLVTLMLNTGSRLSFISLFLGISVIFILHKQRGVFSKILFLVVGVIAAIFLYDLALQSETLATRLTETAEEGNISGRDEIWLSILPLIEDNWIIGVGRTGYIEYITKLYGGIKSPHNVIVEVLAYTGIIGFMLFFGFIGKAFLNAYNYLRKYNEVIPFVFFVPILGIVFTAQILTLKLGWVIFAYAASRALYLKNTTQ